jgi:hypothetical protein
MADNAPPEFQELLDANQILVGVIQTQRRDLIRAQRVTDRYAHQLWKLRMNRCLMELEFISGPSNVFDRLRQSKCL